MKHLFQTLFFSFFCLITIAQNPIETATAGMEKQDGFLPIYWDAKKGKIWAEIKDFQNELLYYTSLAQGLGSNDIGLDRGKLGQEYVVRFRRSGNKVLLIVSNYAYRALSKDPLEQRAVEESFAKSVLWGFEVAAEHEGRVLVDMTPMLMQDAVGAVQDIARARQGNYRFDASRSAVFMPRTKSFPQNTEFEAFVTLTGENAGGYLRAVAPTTAAVSMHQHHSFVQLPDNNYKPRAFDPRIGYIQNAYYDYATPVSEPIEKKFIVRHRLQKKDPSAAMSEAVKPIVYYMDPGAPEPIRSALMEGISWWNQAFEAAGYKDAFQVKLLPADADPMDVRYNLVQWVHRSTRGWSYGTSVVDPRTGEILKGKVTLGSLRVRQDYMIAQGLVGNFETDTSHVAEMMGMSLDRLRQLAAHEVGHTLGLPHNYVSSVHNRASVMDYPHMVAALKQGRIDLSNAYDKSIADYDKWSIIWGYQDFPKNTDEKKALNDIVQQMYAKGLVFLSDQDARPEGSVHPQTHLWDNGASATDELLRVMEVRKVALGNFDERKIRTGTPMANLEEVFVPMYMFHRFQTEATAKVLGGVNYRYSMKGEANLAVTPVSNQQQTQALDALLKTLQPEFLKVPQAVLKLIPPRAYGYDPNPREVFKRRTGLAFDPLGPVEASAGLTLRLLFNPERMSRLAIQQQLDASLPSLDNVLSAIIKATWSHSTSQDYDGLIKRTVQKMVLNHLIELSRNKEANTEAQEIALTKIAEIEKYFVAKKPADLERNLWAKKQIKSLKDNTLEQQLQSTLTPPDGQPIDPGYEWLMPACEWIEK